VIDNHPSIARFRAAYPGVEPFAIARAPGRVNLIGEHIDYNEGIVLPIAINLETRVVIGRTDDKRLRVRSAAQPDELNYDADDIPGHAATSWDAYVRGVAALLLWRGIRFNGCALWIESDIPPGAGLSSSAALEVGVALALMAAAGRSLPMRAVADLCREAEHRFAGVPCGIMDQYACALAQEGHALAIDCHDGSVQHVAWPKSNPAILIVETGIERKLAAGAYAARVRECEEALNIICAFDAMVNSWRDVTDEHLSALEPRLGDVLHRRARHVMSEIARADAAIAAMASGDVVKFGKLMNASHDSLRDDYEVSLPVIDRMVENLQAMNGVYGAKLTGAGFGGCVIALMDLHGVQCVQFDFGASPAIGDPQRLRFHHVAPAQCASVVYL